MLTPKKIASLLNAGAVGRHHDGKGLYLQIVPLKGGGTTGSWVRRYVPPGAPLRTTASGRQYRPERAMGLGGTAKITLAAAREHNAKISAQLAEGVDPIDAKHERITAKHRAAAAATTFGELARAYYDGRSELWSVKHRHQWCASMLGVTPSGTPAKKDYLAGLREMAVSAITSNDVLDVLTPLWRRKDKDAEKDNGARAVTASRLRKRVFDVLEYAKVKGHRTGDNPAAVSIVDAALPPLTQLATVEHFRAVPWAEVPGVVSELRQLDALATEATLFAILTAMRTQETLGATWDEITGDVWTVPGPRMKNKLPHRVPLSTAALAILHGLPQHSGYIFPGTRRGKPLSENSLRRALRRIGRDETVHGMRSSFADWAYEQGYTRDLIDMALAHKKLTKVQAAYLRADLLEQRRPLMQQWGEFCAPAPKLTLVAGRKWG